MTRMAVLVVVALLVGAAWVLEPPRSLDPDSSLVTTTVVEDDDGSVPRFSHCAWAYADGDIDTTFALASLADVEYRLSFPASGELEVLDPDVLAPAAAISLPLSTVRVQGDAPVVVEFTDGPAASAVIAQGDTELAASLCPTSIPKVWAVPGGTTDGGAEYLLRLLNPFADDARVDIVATSELGSEALPGFEGISIPARAARTISLHEEIPGRANVALSIEQIEGSVIPMAQVRLGPDIAVWAGVRQSETWEVPVTMLTDAPGTLVLMNDALIEVEYSLDVFGADGSVAAGPSGAVPGPGTTTIPLDATIGAGPFGVRVSADGPIASAVVFAGEEAHAVEAGVPRVSSRWLIPGPNADPTARYRLWLMNSGVEDVAVEYRFMDPVGDTTSLEEVIVPATSVLSVPVTDVGSAGILLDASAPVSVMFTTTFGGAAGIGPGVAIGD